MQQETAEQIGGVPLLLARPPGIAEQPEKAAEAVDTTTGAKPVGEARLVGTAKQQSKRYEQSSAS